MAHNNEKVTIDNKIDLVMSNKIRINGLKKSVETDIQGEVMKNQELDRQVDEL